MAKPTAQRILVTGADGFIGARIASGLRDAGHDVLGLVFGRSAREHELRIDLREPGGLSAVPPGISSVVHAAGIVDARAKSSTIFAVNLGGTRNLLDWARARSVSHFVQLSSVAVYGPYVVGEQRGEQTARLGAQLGLPYMRSKARAEAAIVQSGVPYTLLRPPAVLGPGDTVLTEGFVTALRSHGLPLLPRARLDHRVSLSFVDGLVDIVKLALARGPLHGAVHAVDAELTLGELAEVYASALGVRMRTTPVSWPTLVRRREDAGFAWLAVSARFGQHYTSERLRSELGYVSRHALADVVRRAVAPRAVAAEQRDGPQQ